MPAEKPVEVRKEITQKQIEANRRNAKKSRGPVTSRGRAISSQNARKYDLFPNEDPKLPARLTAQYYGRYVPANERERHLVDIMVFSDRVRRCCAALEDRIYAHELADTEDRTIEEALECATERLIPVNHHREAAECAHKNAMHHLKFIRVKAA